MALASLFTRTTLSMLSGVLIWATHFLLIYVFTALACARGFADLNWLGVGVIPWVIGTATLIAATACLVMILRAAYALGTHRASEEPLRFVHWMTAMIATLALVAITLESLPVLLVPACA